jgi:hypothetical protein
MTGAPTPGDEESEQVHARPEAYEARGAHEAVIEWFDSHCHLQEEFT